MWARLAFVGGALLLRPIFAGGDLNNVSCGCGKATVLADLPAAATLNALADSDGGLTLAIAPNVDGFAPTCPVLNGVVALANGSEMAMVSPGGASRGPTSSACDDIAFRANVTVRTPGDVAFALSDGSKTIGFTALGLLAPRTVSLVATDGGTAAGQAAVVSWMPATDALAASFVAVELFVDGGHVSVGQLAIDGGSIQFVMPEVSGPARLAVGPPSGIVQAGLENCTGVASCQASVELPGSSALELSFVVSP